MLDSRLDIVPIDSSDPSQDNPLEEWNEIHIASDRVVHGARSSSYTTAELREFARSPHREMVRLLVRDPHGAAVGAGQVNLPLRDNTSVAVLWLSVHPAHRRRGVGTELLEALEAEAASRGRTTLLAETQFLPGDPDVFGEGFARPHGYRPAQTVLRSELALPLGQAEEDRLASLRDTTGGYAVEVAIDELPTDWLEDRAELQRRMSTDIPLGELQLEEEVWDAARVLSDFEMVMAAGRHAVEAVVRDLEGGHLVGYSNLAISPGSPELAYQGDTLVMREHRGHGLGLRLKAATALALAERFPGVTAVRTWNAEDNEHMLAVNRGLGFVVDGIEREWQKITR